MDKQPPMSAFSFARVGTEFEAELLELIHELLEAERSKFINPENALSFAHGGRWLEDKGPDEVGESGFVEHGHELVLQLQDVVAQKLDVLPHYVSDIVSTFTKSFIKSVYDKIEEVTDRTGNVVDQKKHASPAMAFVEILEKIQFSVDREGNVSRPTLHLGKEAHEKLHASLEAGGKELKAKIEEITKRKEAEALEREQARRKKFKGPQ
jgi:hypothetical protein